MELHKKQSEFIESTKRYKLLNWGRRSGKTTALAYEVFIELWNNDSSRVAYYAPTHDDAREIAWEMMKEVLKDIIVDTNESLLRITTKNKYGTTSKVVLTGWEAVKNRDKGRGVENDLVILDECAFYPAFKEKYEKVIEPTLLTSKGRLIMASTPNGFNHFYDYASLAESSDDWFFSHCTSYDNPANPVKDLDRLKEEKTDDAFSQEYMADFRKLTGLVYKEFNRERHLFGDDAVINQAEWLGAVDFGFTNPTGVLSAKFDKDKHYWITDDFYKTGLTHEVVGDYVANKNYEKVYPDPASPEAIEVLRQKGVNVYEVIKGADSIEAGIQKVRDLFKQGRIHIHKDCVNLIYELETYRYPEKKSERNEYEKPIKENDHLADCLRYMIMSHNPETRNLAEERMRYNLRRRNPSTNFIK